MPVRMSFLSAVVSLFPGNDRSRTAWEGSAWEIPLGVLGSSPLCVAGHPPSHSSCCCLLFCAFCTFPWYPCDTTSSSTRGTLKEGGSALGLCVPLLAGGFVSLRPPDFVFYLPSVSFLHCVS